MKQLRPGEKLETRTPRLGQKRLPSVPVTTRRLVRTRVAPVSTGLKIISSSLSIFPPVHVVVQQCPLGEIMGAVLIKLMLETDVCLISSESDHLSPKNAIIA